MLIIRKLTIIWIALAPVLQVTAKLRFSPVFSDHMVLQRDATVRVWGWADPYQHVQLSVSWLEKNLTTRAGNNGKWEVSLETPHAGGPYQLTCNTDDEEIVLVDVLIGEVWVCAGQSNMVWGAQFGHEEMLQELPHAYHPTIRLFNIDRSQSPKPLDTLSGSWRVCDSASASQFTAIGYFAAKALGDQLGIPIGIISSCAGSTTVETWTPAQVFDDKPSLQLLTNHYFPIGDYWNAMIHPFVGYQIAGVFWYQGEGNVISYTGYERLFGELVRAWRAAWGYEFPFYQVQIAPFAYRSQGVLGNKAAFLREQQTRTLSSVSQTGLVVTTDLVPDVSQIHPPKKKAIADRLVRLALKEVYGLEAEDYRSPVYAGYQVNHGVMLIHFKFVTHGLHSIGERPTDIFVAGEDRVFHPADAHIRGNVLEVSSPQVACPVAVRFGFSDTARPNLFNSNGLPVSPFRTDNWDIP